MPLFGNSDKVFTRDSYYKWCQDMPAYKALEQLFGAMNGSYLIGILFEQRVQPPVGPQSSFTIPGAQVQNFTTQTEQIFREEHSRIVAKQQYIDGLWERALGGQLRARLANSAAPDNYNPAGNLQGKYLATEKARHWITTSMRGNTNGVLAALAKYTLMNNIRALGPDDSITRDIFKIVVRASAEDEWAATQNNPNVAVKMQPKALVHARGPATSDPNIAYPSSIGGSFLLRWLFTKTGRSFWPGSGDERWVDIALFYLGAITTVQAFTDGNKRVARTAYAIVMVNGGVPFVAPDVPYENELGHMQK